MTKILAWLKQWAWPLLRTFLVVFVLVFVAGLAKIDFRDFHASDLDVIGSLALGALGSAINVLVIGVQKLLPFLPDPVAPTTVIEPPASPPAAPFAQQSPTKAQNV